MKVTYVLFVSATKYVNLVTINSSRVAPSGVRKRSITSEVKFDALNLQIRSIRFNKVIQEEHINIVKVHILTMTSSKRHDSVLTQRRNRMESLCLEAIDIRNFKLTPSAFFNVQCPHVCHISIVCLTTTDDHILVNKAACMISSWTRHR